jgi:hypothetical protein
MSCILLSDKSLSVIICYGNIQADPTCTVSIITCQKQLSNEALWSNSHSRGSGLNGKILRRQRRGMVETPARHRPSDVGSTSGFCILFGVHSQPSVLFCISPRPFFSYKLRMEGRLDTASILMKTGIKDSVSRACILTLSMKKRSRVSKDVISGE